MTDRTDRITPVGRRALTRLRLLVAIVALIVVSPLATGLDAADRVNIRVWPATSMAPTSFTVRVIIERQAANRWIKVTVESENFSAAAKDSSRGNAARGCVSSSFVTCPRVHTRCAPWSWIRMATS